MRVCLAKYLVDRMRDGTEVQEACVMGIRRILDLRDPFGGRLNVLALDRNGRAGAASMEDGIVYCYQDERMDHPEKRESVQIKI